LVPENHEALPAKWWILWIEAVDPMDLSLLLAGYEGGGPPAYHPAMMLKAIMAVRPAKPDPRQLLKGLVGGLI
jgi:transposase